MKVANKISSLYKKIAVVLLLVCFSSQQAFAHNRRFVFTEEYRTIPKGGFELENWVRLKVPDGNKTNENTFQFQEELEYGITDRWTVANYLVWERENQHGLDNDGVEKKDSTKFDSYKLETKYRFGEKGKYWLDPLIYLEWERDARGRNPNTIEGKLVLSKDIGKLNFTYNQIIESKLGRGGRTEHNFRFASTYELPYDLYVGGEFIGNLWHPSDHKNELALGPTLAYEAKYFWATCGIAWAVNKHTDDVQARLVVGVPFG